MNNDPIDNRLLVERTSLHAFPLHSSSCWNTIYNHRLTNFVWGDVWLCLFSAVLERKLD